MRLAAYRPEYRIYVDTLRNLIVYERLEQQTLVSEIPYFLPDWERILTQVEPGFRLLIDVTRTLGPNLSLLPQYLRLRELFREAGVAVIAEVLPHTHNMRQLSGLLAERQTLPVARFHDRLAAERFLLEHSSLSAAAC